MNSHETKNDSSPELTSPEIINLVIARLKTIPANAQLSIGDSGKALPVEDLIREVQNQTEIGKKVIESQLFFLRSLQNLPSV